MTRTLGNGTSTTYGHDAVSRLSGLSLTGAQASAATFTYNPAGQIATRTGSNDAYAYTGAYDVDRGYSVNRLNQYTASGGVVPACAILTHASGPEIRFSGAS